MLASQVLASSWPMFGGMYMISTIPIASDDYYFLLVPGKSFHNLLRRSNTNIVCRYGFHIPRVNMRDQTYERIEAERAQKRAERMAAAVAE